MNVEARVREIAGAELAGQLQRTQQERRGRHRRAARPPVGSMPSPSSGRSARRAEEEIETVLPAHTHTQPAQPVLLAHHLLAYVETRDRGRLADAVRRADRSPAGSGGSGGSGTSDGAAWRAAWASATSRPAASMPSRTATTRSRPWPPRRSLSATSRGLRRTSSCGRPEVRLRAHLRRLRDRQLDAPEQAQPGHRGAAPRAGGGGEREVSRRRRRSYSRTRITTVTSRRRASRCSTPSAPVPPACSPT